MILEIYGSSLSWIKAEPGIRLTPENAQQLHHEGYTMVLVRDGLWKTRQVSLIRFMQRLPRQP
ncbi:hypothetical protein IFU40_07745 [Microbacterium sp. CFBP 13617]|uniref:hypothetical protein n=1 Tax=Microbacterium sp. CFBP 13617 TaxID=2774035 RepID=UPI001781ECCC|nr:hypothetical protein [Microbacterium sp. CFBP 13617]MBD8218518.1 hypothetical protein [Microbacterium sp. CFBP 13617]